MFLYPLIPPRGRQKDFIDTEKSLGRLSPETMSAVVGYAGGRAAGPGGKVCYYYSDPRTVYERLGHAEVVQVALSDESDAAKQEFRWGEGLGALGNTQ